MQFGMQDQWGEVGIGGATTDRVGESGEPQPARARSMTCRNSASACKSGAYRVVDAASTIRIVTIKLVVTLDLWGTSARCM